MTTEVLVPGIGYELTALVPYAFQSCVLAPPPPQPEPQPEEAIFTPVPPGIEYESLPVLDPATQIIDTSPSQIIGCANAVPDGAEQSTLNALFPGAVDGDGVVNRQNNDIWKYDGTAWENVGPTPGPQVVVVSVLPPWNETSIYNAPVRTRLVAQKFDYALESLAEVDPIVVRTIFNARQVTAVVAPVTGLEIQAPAPTALIQDPAISLVASPYRYEPTGAPLTVDVGYEPGIIWTRTLGDSFPSGVYIFDVQRGPTKYMRAAGFQVEQTDAQSITAFTPVGFEVGTSTLLNNVSSIELHGGHTFRPALPAASNTDGTITSTVSVGNVYSIITYTGNGTAGATVGHGMPTVPQLIILHRLGPSRGEPRAGGPVVGDDHTMILDLYGNRTSSTAFIRSADTSSIVLGNNSDVNASGSTYLAYAFRNEPRLSKIDTYAGNGDLSGQFIDCGFKVDYLLIKRRDGGVGFPTEWQLFDRTDQSGRLITPWLEGSQYLISSVNHSLTDRGFIAFRGEDRRDDPFFSGDYDPYTDINENGATYLYMAFAYVVPTVRVPAGIINIEALVPMPGGGASVAVGTVALDFVAMQPVLVGKFRIFALVATTNISLAITPPEIRAGVRISAPLSEFSVQGRAPQILNNFPGFLISPISFEQSANPEGVTFGDESLQSLETDTLAIESSSIQLGLSW
jgi:hypothetical protein